MRKAALKSAEKPTMLRLSLGDTQDNTTRAKEGMEKMVQEGIHYVIGPNTDPTAAAVRPVAEKDGRDVFSLCLSQELYSQPASNAILGMIANYQSGPAIYKYLKENSGVKSIAFLAANESDALSQRKGGVQAAKALGLKVVAEDAYQSDTRDFAAVVTPIVKLKPDLLVLSGVAGGTARLLFGRLESWATRDCYPPKRRKTRNSWRKARALWRTVLFPLAALPRRKFVPR